MFDETVGYDIGNAGRGVLLVYEGSAEDGPPQFERDRVVAEKKRPSAGSTTWVAVPKELPLLVGSLRRRRSERRQVEGAKPGIDQRTLCADTLAEPV